MTSFFTRHNPYSKMAEISSRNILVYVYEDWSKTVAPRVLTRFLKKFDLMTYETLVVFLLDMTHIRTWLRYNQDKHSKKHTTYLQLAYWSKKCRKYVSKNWIFQLVDHENSFRSSVIGGNSDYWSIITDHRGNCTRASDWWSIIIDQPDNTTNAQATDDRF